MLIGVGCGIAVAHLLGLDPPGMAVAAAIGAHLPDVDRTWAPGPPPWPGAPCRLDEHRGPTHSIVAAAVVGLLLNTAWGYSPWLRGSPVGLGVSIGYLSHLVADGLSYLGVPYLWPLSAARIRLLPYGLRIRSGSRLIEMPIALAVFLFGCWGCHHAEAVGGIGVWVDAEPALQLALDVGIRVRSWRVGDVLASGSQALM